VSTTQRPSGLNVVTYKSSLGSTQVAAGYAGDTYGYAPLWSGGEQVDAYGYHDGSYPQRQFDAIYRTQPYVAAVVNKLMRQVARTPIKVFRVSSSGDHVRVREDGNDPGASLVKLLKRPTPRKSAISLKQWMMWPLLVFGNALLAKYYGDGPDFPPTELIPMNWQYVTPYAQQGGDVELWRTTQTGSERYVDALSTIHFGWDTCGPVGVSPLEQLAISIKLEDAAQRLQVASFRNAARPSGGISMPQGTNPNKLQMDQMRRDVEAMHRGVDNAFKVALLAPGAQWVPMMFSLQEAEMMATRAFNREEVCSVYDVKPGQVGIMSDPGAARASVVEVNRDLYRTTLPPWFTLIEETIESQLIEPEPLWEGLQVEFETADMLRGEPEAVASQIASMIQSMQITPNEGRDINGLPRVSEPEADKLYGQLVSNLVALGTPPVIPGALEPPILPPPSDVAAPTELSDPTPAQQSITGD
jgi:HK97 family phage portal protein